MYSSFIEFIEIIFSTRLINSMMHEHSIRSAMLIVYNGVARTLKNTHIKGRLLYQAMVLYISWELFLKERISSLWGRILSFKSSSFRFGKSLLPH